MNTPEILRAIRERDDAVELRGQARTRECIFQELGDAIDEVLNAHAEVLVTSDGRIIREFLTSAYLWSTKHEADAQHLVEFHAKTIRLLNGELADDE